jgi:pilus assembly protein TadC
VKMVFPIVIFILPALFIVILAPGILSILRDIRTIGRP